METAVKTNRQSNYSKQEELSMKQFLIWISVALIWALFMGILYNKISPFEHVWYIKIAELFIVLPPIFGYTLIRQWVTQQWNLFQFLKLRSIWIISAGILIYFLVTFLTHPSLFSTQMRSFLSGPVSFLSLNDQYNATPIQAWLYILAGCVIAPFCEELLFRGIIFNFLKKRYNLWTGLLVSSVVFALGHLEPTNLPFLLLSGFILALVAHFSKSIISSMIVHGSWNLFAIVLLSHYLSIYQLF